jgi:prepilin-type processing-associated H-X9-DG protein
MQTLTKLTIHPSRKNVCFVDFHNQRQKILCAPRGSWYNFCQREEKMAKPTSKGRSGKSALELPVYLAAKERG